MLDPNHFSMRDQYIFVCYSEVIKLTYPVMLKEIINDYYDELEQFFDLDLIKDFDIYNLERLCIERITKNPLEYIKKPETTKETCDILLEAFEEEMIEMYTKSKLSVFGANLYNIFLQPFIKKVYIYSEKPLTQVQYDCDVYFNEFSNKIQYVAGDFIDIIKELPDKPTSYVLNNTDYIQRLIDNNLIAYTEIMIGEAGYNFELDENNELRIKGGYEDLMEEKIFKLGIVPLINFDEKHVTNTVKNDKND